MGILHIAAYFAAALDPAAPTERQDIAAGDEDIFALEEEMVSTASRTAEPIRKAPASVTVVTERELRAFGATNTADALLGVRGTFQTNDGLYQSIGVRGFNRFGDYGNRLQVQIDGHVMNDDWIFSSYVGTDQLTDLHHVESIEVVRGPGSALYGTGAFFGVINLKTPRKAPPYTFRLGGGVVDMSTLRVHADGGQDLTALAGQEAGAWLSVAGSSLPPRDYASPAYVGTPWAPDGIAKGVDAFSTATTTGKAWLGDFTLAFSLHQRDRIVPTGAFGVAFGDVRNQAQDRRGFAELRYEPVLTSWAQLFARAYVDHQHYGGSYASTDRVAFLSTESFDGNWGGVETRLLLTPLEGLRVTAGAQVETHPFNRWFGQENAKDPPYQDQASVFHYVSLYGVGDWQPMPWLLVSAGARLDAWVFGSASVYGEAAATDANALLPSLNPRVAVIWMPSDDDTVKLLGGRSYRVPSVYELTYSVNGLDFTDGASLGPESIYTTELEYRRRLAADTHVIGSIYGNAIVDLITYLDGDDVPATGEAYYNVKQPLYTVGAELEIRQDLPGGVLAAAQVSVQRTRVDDIVNGAPIPNSAERTMAAWLVVPLAGEQLQLAQRVVVEQDRLDRSLLPVDPFFTWDAMLTARFADLPFSFTVGIENLLDWKNVHPVSVDTLDNTIRQDGRALRAEVFAWF